MNNRCEHCRFKNSYQCIDSKKPITIMCETFELDWHSIDDSMKNDIQRSFMKIGDEENAEE